MKGIYNALLWMFVWSFLVVATFGIALIPFVVYVYLTLAGTDRRRERAESNLGSTLMADETALSLSLQHRLFALWHRRAVIAITSSRIIVLNRGLLGGFRMQDIQWKDLQDARRSQNVLPHWCGSNLAFGHFNGGVGAIEIDGVPDREAAEIYSRAQAEEQAWEEKRRVREIEEARAASGGITIQNAMQPSAVSAPAGHHVKMLAAIHDAKALLDSGAISDAEFQEMKAKIISSH